MGKSTTNGQFSIADCKRLPEGNPNNPIRRHLYNELYGYDSTHIFQVLCDDELYHRVFLPKGKSNLVTHYPH